MPFERPTLSELVDQTKADIEARLQGADAHLRRNVLEVLAIMHAGAMHGEYGAIDYLSRQILPDTADDDVLLRWAAMLGLSRSAANSATGSVVLSGVMGTVVESGIQVQNSDGTQIYQTIQSVTLEEIPSDPTQENIREGTVPVIALIPGAAANAAPDTPLTLSATLSNVQQDVYVATDGINGGQDAQTIESLRSSVLARLKQPPRGGAAHDYVTWAKEASTEVTRVFVSPKEAGIGTVTVRFLTDNSDNIIPSDELVALVRDHIGSQAPIDIKEIYVYQPIPITRHIIISDLQVSNDFSITDVRNAISTELDDLFDREAVPGNLIAASKISESISLSLGEVSHGLTTEYRDANGQAFDISNFGPGHIEVVNLENIEWL